MEEFATDVRFFGRIESLWGRNGVLLGVQRAVGRPCGWNIMPWLLDVGGRSDAGSCQRDLTIPIVVAVRGSWEPLFIAVLTKHARYKVYDF